MQNDFCIAIKSIPKHSLPSATNYDTQTYLSDSVSYFHVYLFIMPLQTCSFQANSDMIHLDWQLDMQLLCKILSVQVSVDFLPTSYAECYVKASY